MVNDKFGNVDVLRTVARGCIALRIAGRSSISKCLHVPPRAKLGTFMAHVEW